MIVKQSTSENLDEKEIIKFAVAKGITLDEFAHDFSIDVAKKYLEGVYEYSFSKKAANWLFDFLTYPAYLSSTNAVISKVPVEICLAFCNEGVSSEAEITEKTKSELTRILEEIDL